MRNNNPGNVERGAGFQGEVEGNDPRFATFDSPEAGIRRVAHAELSLPSVVEARLIEYPFDPEVQRHVTLLMTARAREEAVRQLDAGNAEAARDTLRKAMAPVAAAPAAPAMKEELASLQELEADIASGSTARARKKATFESYARKSSRPSR